jgi:hypothetical protein
MTMAGSSHNKRPAGVDPPLGIGYVSPVKRVKDALRLQAKKRVITTVDGTMLIIQYRWQLGKSNYLWRRLESLHQRQ